MLLERARRFADRAKTLSESPITEPGSWMQRLRDIRQLLVEFQDIEEIGADLPGMIALLDDLLDLINPVNIARRHLTGRLKAIAQFSDEQLNDARQKIPELSPDQRRQTRFLRALVLTDDAFGIVLRGHVLVENAIEACIYQYLPNPQLLKKLNIFFSKKIRLAFMLGIISKDERDILNALNVLRNKVAHFEGDVLAEKSPDFVVTADDERALWSEFAHNPAMCGEWPEYERNKFPLFLRYFVVHLYVYFDNRARRLRQRRLPPVHMDLKFSEMERAVMPYSSMLIVTAVSKLESKTRHD